MTEMKLDSSQRFQKIVKASIGWAGLVYFFLTSYEVWGEAIGLTLFFASGQLQNAVKPPLEGVIIGPIASEDMLEAWRITIGLAPLIYYFYFVLYLDRSVTIYVSTICLSLLWESQIVDDAINCVTSWMSRDMVNSTKSLIKKVASLKPKSIKAFARNIVQDFLCVLCKLYKHLIMNCTIMNCFLLSHFNYLNGATISESNEICCVKKSKRSHASQMAVTMKKSTSKYLAYFKHVISGKVKPCPILSRVGSTISYGRINDGCQVKYCPISMSIPVSSCSQNIPCNRNFRKWKGAVF